jgi:hypothetical protein
VSVIPLSVMRELAKLELPVPLWSAELRAVTHWQVG